MSGPIRRQMGPAKRRIQTTLQEADTFHLNERLDPNLDFDALDDLEEQIGNVHCRLNKQLESIQTHDTAWRNFLERMEEDKLEEEEELYNTAADGENGFINLSNNAQDILALLDRRLAVIQQKKNRLENAQQLLPMVPQHPQQQQLNGQPNLQHGKLPELTLQKFSGEVREWPEFWDGCRSSIHDRLDLSNVKKLAYLKSSLTGRAAEVVKGVSTTDANYQVALDLLDKNFGNREVQINALYTDWWGLQAASSNLQELKTLMNSTQRILRQLAQLNDDIAPFSSTLDWFRRKLPQSVRIELERNKEAEPNWSLEHLLEALRKYLDARMDGTDSIFYTKTTGRSNHQGNTFKSFETGAVSRLNQNSRSSAEALVAVKDHIASKKCVFCSGNHFNDQCVTFKSRNDRLEKAKKDKRCFICLRTDHMVRQCPYSESRSCFYCKKFGHNRALCGEKFGASAKGLIKVCANTVENTLEKAVENSSVQNNSNLLSVGQYTMLLTATVMARRPNSSRILPCRLILDSGSHMTYIHNSLAARLNLVVNNNQQLSVSTFASDEAKELESYNTNIEIFLKDGSTKLISVNGVSKLTGQMNREVLCTADLTFLKQISPEELADIIPSHKDSYCPDILIGNDYFWDFIKPGERKFLPSGLHLIPSTVGLLIGGHTTNFSYRVSKQASSTQSFFISTMATFMGGNTPNMAEFWSLESLGITDSLGKDENDKVLINFESSLVFEDNRYQVRWPWKDDIPNLESNFGLALGRMRSLTKRLQLDTELKRKYAEIIEDQSKKGITEIVNESISESLQNGRFVHYLPHHPIMTPQKATTKVRIVYDASAKLTANHSSLNDCLYQGPNLIPNLCGMLLRFRLPKIVIISDIEKAFLQIGLQMPDRDVTRFLWFKDPTKTWIGNNLENLEIQRFCRIPFGVSSSPFLLEAVIKHHLKKVNTELAKEIEQNLYVDNIMVSANTSEEGYAKYEEGKKMFNAISMNLREWTSNDASLNQKIPVKDQVKGDKIKLLGINWELATDAVKIIVPNSVCVTQSLCRRKLLSMVASIFDPLGYWNPSTLVAKVFFQELWHLGFSWDILLPLEIQNRWSDIFSDIQGIGGSVIPRWVLTDGWHRFQLVVFSDASSKAYGAAVYLIVYSAQGVKSNLLFSKMRLKPVKSTSKTGKSQEISIPRLELLGVLLGVRALKFVREQLNITSDKATFFTDSQCVLQWLNSEKTLTTFVRNRVQEIKRAENIEFYYVSSAENPADLLTRGEQATKLSTNRMWWNGPSWLTEPENKWPKFCYDKSSEKFLDQSREPVACQAVHPVPIQPPFGIDAMRFSSLGKLLRVTAYCLCFLQMKCPNGVQKIESLKNIENETKITATNITIAKNLWNRYLQSKHFAGFFTCEKIHHNSSIPRELGIFLDSNGILRCAGRFQNFSDFQWNKFPILLPRNEQYTRLLIQDVHEKVMHGMVNRTLAEVRKHYWITQGRAEVKKILRDCKVCCRYNTGPFKLPAFPPLPKFRLEPSFPFSIVGLDYFGHILIKDASHLCKKWVCLFTCLTTRAVHLELVSDLSASEFLACFNRFCARRGCPTKIISDNAKQFKLADVLIAEALENMKKIPDVAAKLASLQVTWKFIPEFSPWQGGIYERMVGTVKTSLRKALGRRLLTSDQLQTVLCEIESIINGRPLTYLSAEFPEQTTLSPSDFLTPGKANIILNTVTETNIDPDYNPSTQFSTRQKIEKLWKKQLCVLNHFWKIWRTDYLNALRERKDFQHPQKKVRVERQPVVGEVVLIKDDKQSRGMWKIGRISELNESKDKQTRTAKLQLPNATTVTRPISLLYPLESGIDE